jgi:hypothetical protein
LDVTPCGSVRTDVSEEYIVSTFRVKGAESLWFAARIIILDEGEAGELVSPRLQDSSSPSVVRYILAAKHGDSEYLTLKMEAIRSSETSVLTRTTRKYIPEDTALHCYHRENAKSSK